MARTVRRTSRSPQRANRRKFVWARNFNSTAITGDAVGTDLLSEFETAYGAQLIGCTITRIRGYFFAWGSNTAAEAQDAYRMGIRVTTGFLELNPLDQDNSPWNDDWADWMAWEPFATVPALAGAQLLGDGVLNARMIDVRAQRRLDELGQRLVLLHGGAPAAPTITWGVGWDLSIGIKLP